jgi:hypothetical protein
MLYTLNADFRENVKNRFSSAIPIMCELIAWSSFARKGGKGLPLLQIFELMK